MKRSKKITLQTKGISIGLKKQAEAQAEQDGFTSYQEVIRLFTKLYANGGFPMNITWGAGLDKDVQKSLKDIREGSLTELPLDKDLSDVIN